MTSTSTSSEINTPSGPGASEIESPSTDSAISPSTPLSRPVDEVENDRDVPIPSIEQNDEIVQSVWPQDSSMPQPRAPSVSISPPHAEVDSRQASSSPLPHMASASRSSTIDNIIQGAGNMTLGTDDPQPRPRTPERSSRGNSLEPNTTPINATAERLSFSRRRSSSQIRQPPYDIRDETLPDHPFHNPIFQREFNNAKLLVARLTDVLGSSTLRHEEGSTVACLYQRAGDLSRFTCPSTRTVGFVGESGVGKSSLLNSLLDHEGLARTSNSGAACTCVATEFHYHDDDNFTIDVEYFTMEEVEEQFTELLQAYRRYHLRDERDENSDDANFRERAETARDTFRAAFTERLRTDDGFLLSETEGSALARLLGWARESGVPLMAGASNAQRNYTALNVRQCSERLMELTSDITPESEGAAWPFIHKIKVYLRAYILSKGLILVDLPGLRDLNSARMQIAERYMLCCDEIFVICNIGRATTDLGVEEVFTLAQRANLTNVGIVCTKSDDIRADEAMRDWGGAAATNINSLIMQTRNDQLLIEQYESDIEELQSSYESPMERESAAGDLLQLSGEVKSAKIRKSDHEFELKRFLMETRNQKVIQELRQTYQSRVAGGQSPIFCVSNKDYWDNRPMPREKALPFLQLSCILDFRRHCISIVAEAQLRAAKSYTEDELPALLESVELWIQAGAADIDMERRRAIRAVVGQVDNRLQALRRPTNQVYGVAGLMKRHFRDQIFRVMGAFIPDWTRSAEEACLEWQGWHHATYSAFCRNFGDHCTAKTIRRRCWNEEAIQAMVENMNVRWAALRTAAGNVRDSNYELIGQTFDQATALCDNTIPVNTMRSLSASLVHRKNLFLFQMELLGDEFEDRVSALRRDTLTGIRTSLVGESLEGAYRASNLESGTGSDRRRKNIIHGAFSDVALFESIQRRSKNRFTLLAEDLQSKILEAVDAHLQLIFNDLEILRDENAAVESERNPEFRMLVERELQRASREIRTVNQIINMMPPDGN